MYSNFKIGFLKFFGLNYKRAIERPLRHAFSMGDPLRYSRDAKIFIFFDFKKRVHNFLFSNISKVFYKFLNNFRYVLKFQNRIFKIFWFEL